MPLWYAILLALLTLAALATLVFYGVVASRVWRASRTLPTARDGIALAERIAEFPELTVIIPAHNERDVIGRVARSLLASDYPALSVVFVLDRCTDDTEAILREAILSESGEPDPRVEIIVNEHCPDGWAGKVHAMHRGYREAKALDRLRSPDEASWTPKPGVDVHDLSRGLVLFADADTAFDPRCLRAAAALLIERDLDLLSLLSTLTRERWYEKLVQPAATFELVRQYPLDHVNDPTKARLFANGQFMLFRRAAFDSIGGHAGVQNALLEDIQFAKIFGQKPRGLRLGCLIADGMLSCEMYRDEAAFERGWKRIFTEAASRRTSKLRSSSVRLLLFGAILPVLSELAFWFALAAWLLFGLEALVGATLAVSALAFLAFCLAMGMVYRQQHQNPLLIAFFPYGAWKIASLLRRAARDLQHGTQTQWGGRQYTREAQK